MSTHTDDLPYLTMAWINSPNYVKLDDHQKVIFSIICDQPGPHHVRDLANRFGLERYIITRVCDKLSEEGLIIRVPTPGDKRDLTLQATGRGATVRAAMRSVGVQ